jgi:hypothetical protein
LSTTVITLDTDASGLPHGSVAVHVSVTDPQPLTGDTEKVEGLEVPVIKHPPVKPLLKVMVLGAGIAPQATVVFASAIIVGSVAGLTVIFLETDAIVLPHTSVAVQVSTTTPPHAPAGV